MLQMLTEWVGDDDWAVVAERRIYGIYYEYPDGDWAVSVLGLKLDRKICDESSEVVKNEDPPSRGHRFNTSV